MQPFEIEDAELDAFLDEYEAYLAEMEAAFGPWVITIKSYQED